MYTCDSTTGCSKVLLLRNLNIDPLHLKTTVVEVARTALWPYQIFGDSLIYTPAKKPPDKE